MSESKEFDPLKEFLRKVFEYTSLDVSLEYVWNIPLKLKTIERDNLELSSPNVSELSELSKNIEKNLNIFNISIVETTFNTLANSNVVEECDEIIDESCSSLSFTISLEAKKYASSWEGMIDFMDNGLSNMKLSEGSTEEEGEHAMNFAMGCLCAALKHCAFDPENDDFNLVNAEYGIDVWVRGFIWGEGDVAEILDKHFSTVNYGLEGLLDNAMTVIECAFHVDTEELTDECNGLDIDQVIENVGSMIL